MEKVEKDEKEELNEAVKEEGEEGDEEEQDNDEDGDGNLDDPEEVEIREMKHRLEKFGCYWNYVWTYRYKSTLVAQHLVQAITSSRIQHRIHAFWGNHSQPKSETLWSKIWPGSLTLHLD